MSDTGFDLTVASRLYVGLSTLDIYCVPLVRTVRKTAMPMMAATYLVYLPRNYEVHGVSVVSSEEHLELPPILMDAAELLVLLFILIHDEREKCHASPLGALLEGIIWIRFADFLAVPNHKSAQLQ